MSATQSVQTFGKKKTATAVALAKVSEQPPRRREAERRRANTRAHAQEGKGLIKINGVPLSLYGTPILRGKLYEPVLLLQQFVSSTTSLGSPLERVDIRLRVSGGGHTSQLYALRQAIAKAVVAYVAKYEDAASALEIRKVLVAYDRTLLVADPRRCEPKKFGGKGARSRFQKSCVIPTPSLVRFCVCRGLTLSFRARNQLPLKGSEGTERKRKRRRRRQGGGKEERRRGGGEREAGAILHFSGPPPFPPNNNQQQIEFPLPPTLPRCLSTFSIPPSSLCGEGEEARCGGGGKGTSRSLPLWAETAPSCWWWRRLSVLYSCWLWGGGGFPQPSSLVSLSLPFYPSPPLSFFYPAFLFPSSL